MQTFFLKNIKKSQNTFSTDEIIKRLKQITGEKNERQLAARLGVAQSTMSTWKKRNSIDIKLIIEQFPAININYLIYGVSDEVIKEEINTAKEEINTVKEETAIYKADDSVLMTKEEIENIKKIAKYEVFEKVYANLFNKEVPQ
jgi:transcriptional regulator with XRE-family HTH domain